MTAPATRRLRWLLPLVLYAIFLWRSPYSLRIFALRLLDWLVPMVGLGAWTVVRWRQRATWPGTMVDLPLLAWLAAVALTTAFSTSLRLSLKASWETYLLALILWVLVDAVRHRWTSALWQALYLGGAVVCVIGAIEMLAWYFGWPLLPQFQQGWFGIGGFSNPLPPIWHRVGLPLVNITALSGFLALLIPPAITILVSAREREPRTGMALWLVAAAGILVLSQSRGGLLALAASLTFLLLGSMRSPGFRGWSARIGTRARILLLAAGLVLLIGSAGAGTLVLSREAGHSSGDAVRMDLWRSAWAMVQDDPATGAGPAAYGPELRQYRDPWLAREHIVSAHNLYLNVAAEMGVVGLVAGAWLLGAVGWAWWRRWQAETPGTAAWWRVLGVGAALAGLAVQSVVDTFTESAILLVAAFFVAYVVAPLTTRRGQAWHRRRWTWIVALGLLLAGALGMAWDLWGQAQFGRAVRLTQEGEVPAALEATAQARTWDPWMPLYACHESYLYGIQAAPADGNLVPSADGDMAALKDAIDGYQECLAGPVVPGWTDHLNLAALRWQAGQRQEALAAAREITRQVPLAWLPWLNRGVWAEESGARDEALASYGWVLALDPELAGSPFWTQGARAAWWDEILSSGEEAVAELGREPTSWRWQALVAAGRFEEAQAEIEEWLEVYPGDPGAMIWLGEALAGQGRPREALPWLDQALARAPYEAHGTLVRGEVELALGQFDETEQDLRTALFLEPVPRVHVGLARLALAREDTARALGEYAEAMRPLSLSQNHYVVLYGRMGWPAPLPQVTRIGYRLDEETALEWGALLELEGDAETAKAVYATALAQDPFLERVRERLEELEGS